LSFQRRSRGGKVERVRQAKKNSKKNTKAPRRCEGTVGLAVHKKKKDLLTSGGERTGSKTGEHLLDRPCKESRTARQGAKDRENKSGRKKKKKGGRMRFPALPTSEVCKKKRRARKVAPRRGGEPAGCLQRRAGDRERGTKEVPQWDRTR